MYFAKRLPDSYGEADAEVAQALAAQIVNAMQHRRLAEEQQRAGAAEARARTCKYGRIACGPRSAIATTSLNIIGRAPAFLDALEQAGESRRPKRRCCSRVRAARARKSSPGPFTTGARARKGRSSP